MSKVDAMRALKQARLEEMRRTAGVPRAAAVVARPPVVVAREARTVVEADAPSGECGHRNMGGRSCTRESGHSEKSHRYG